MISFLWTIIIMILLVFCILFYDSVHRFLQTNDIAFSWGKTCVRRRYSEFAWLRSQLVANYPDR